MGRPSPASRKVVCNCKGIKATGTYKIDGRFLELTSDFGTFRVLVGMMEHRTLANRLLRNLCSKAAEKAARPPEDKPIPATSEPLALELASGTASSSQLAHQPIGGVAVDDRASLAADFDDQHLLKISSLGSDA